MTRGTPPSANPRSNSPLTIKKSITSRFEERWLESLASDTSELIPAREWLVSNAPGRVHAPGEAAGYLNTHPFADLMPQYGLVKLDWYEMPGFSMAVALGSVLILLSMIPVAVVRAVRSRRGDRRPGARGARGAGWIIVGVCLLNLLFLVGVALRFPPTQPSELHDIASITEIAIGLGVLAALLTAGALVCTVLAWKNGYWGVVFRAYYTLVTVAAVAFVWFLNYWRWLGWRY